MDKVNLALFDHDKYNTIYFYAMNADEQIYLRYGGRDASGHTAYLDLDSLKLALEKGLALHERYQAGKLPKKPKPNPLYPSDFPLLMERTLGAGRCVECHLIADFRNQQRELDGIGDRRVYLYRSPDIRRIGIRLDVPKGLVVKEASGAAAKAGLRNGDLITGIEGETVYTFGDLQYHYDKVDRDAKQLAITVERGGEEHRLDVALPPFWWYGNLSYRQWTIEPRVYFTSEPLSADAKAALQLPAEGFAAKVDEVESIASLMGAHNLEIGDVVYSVDGVESDPHTDRPELYVKLRVESGSTVQLGVIRRGERLTLPLKTARMSFRK